ncbi:hypothetical protein AAY473_000287, partial [Plecturocebus cupreus]
MGFSHVGQAVLKLTLGDPSASASQSAGITGVSHRVSPVEKEQKRSQEFSFSQSPENMLMRGDKALPIHKLSDCDLQRRGPTTLARLTSGDPPSSASQSAGIRGMSHRAQPR